MGTAPEKVRWFAEEVTARQRKDWIPGSLALSGATAMRCRTSAGVSKTR